jgi:hypothetical protein
MSGEQVAHDAMKQLQGFLKNEGFYRGEKDGIYGPETGKALADYQGSGRMPKAMHDEQLKQSVCVLARIVDRLASQLRPLGLTGSYEAELTTLQRCVANLEQEGGG